MRNKEEIVYREKEKSGLNTAKVLIEALPYIQRLSGTKIVIKLGGNAILDEGLKKTINWFESNSHLYKHGRYNI